MYSSGKHTYKMCFVQGFEIKTDDILSLFPHFLNNTYTAMRNVDSFFPLSENYCIHFFYFAPRFTTIAYIHAGVVVLSPLSSA